MTLIAQINTQYEKAALARRPDRLLPSGCESKPPGAAPRREWDSNSRPPAFQPGAVRVALRRIETHPERVRAVARSARWTRDDPLLFRTHVRNRSSTNNGERLNALIRRCVYD